MRKFAIFPSDANTKAESISKYFTENHLVNIVTIISNRSAVQVYRRVKRFGIPSFTSTKKNMKEKKSS